MESSGRVLEESRILTPRLKPPRFLDRLVANTAIITKGFKKFTGPLAQPNLFLCRNPKIQERSSAIRHKVPINFTSTKVNLRHRLICKSTYESVSVSTFIFSNHILNVHCKILDSRVDGMWDRTTKNAFPHERQKAPKMGPPPDAAGQSLAFKNVHSFTHNTLQQADDTLMNGPGLLGGSRYHGRNTPLKGKTSGPPDDREDLGSRLHLDCSSPYSPRFKKRCAHVPLQADTRQSCKDCTCLEGTCYGSLELGFRRLVLWPYILFRRVCRVFGIAVCAQYGQSLPQLKH